MPLLIIIYLCPFCVLLPNFVLSFGSFVINHLNMFFTLGQRSSSLHYAACFGRPAIAKVLLRHGANPELRDEDGKTPLDKARERVDEGHREVATILQSPGKFTLFFKAIC